MVTSIAEVGIGPHTQFAGSFQSELTTPAQLPEGYCDKVTLADFVNPFPSVTVSVYVVDDTGVAVGLAIVVELKPVAGDHA